MIVVLLFLMAPGDVSAQQSALEVAGTFRPNGPPASPSRTQVGDGCVVDMTQEYTVEGSLTGGLQVDFRIFVSGDCEEPPGTHEEHWIAVGRYALVANGQDYGGPLIYLADVGADGEVAGTMTLADGLEGELDVGGRFQDGFMRYEGRLVTPPALPGRTPLDVDADTVLALAVTAVTDRFPEIAADDLAAEGSLEFQCWLKRPDETVLALNGEFTRHAGKIELDRIDCLVE